MQSTGQTSTQDLSLVSLQASVITYGIGRSSPKLGVAGREGRLSPAPRRYKPPAPFDTSGDAPLFPQMRLTVNGRVHTLDSALPLSLLELLRDRLPPTRAQFVCGRGEGGAGTVPADRGGV